VLLENQIQYPIEFAAAQDHAVPNPRFPLQPDSLSRLLLLVTTVFWAPLKRFFRCYTSSAELGDMIVALI
jgi:hypothetical protein